MDIRRFSAILLQTAPIFALISYCFINSLFIQKYSSRIISHPFFASAGYCIVVCISVWLFWRKTYSFNLAKILPFVAGMVFTVFGVVVFFHVPVQSLGVDRWSVITSFLDKVFSGEFPYTARSHLNNLPGPFPFYFVIALPFYAVGSIGAMVLAGYWLFIGCATYWFSRNNDKCFVVLLLSASPAFIWEIVCRSTIFFNAVILCTFMLIATNLIKTSKRTPYSFILLFSIGVTGGCILSTRGTMAFPLLCFYSFLFLREKKYRGYCITMLGTVIGFLLTLFPLLLWNFDLFLHNNPFVLQSYSFPKPFLVLFLAAAVTSGIYCRSLYYVFFAQGILMFLLVTVPFLNKISHLGITQAFYHNSFDISYFLFVMPFALLTIIKEPQDIV